MSTTLTFRADKDLHEKLRAKAAAQGKTVSSLIREILRAAVTERSLGERVGHLGGVIDAEIDIEDPWRRALKERNWRP